MIQITQFSFANIFTSYLAGLLTALTPCVYPMIPVVLGSFGNVSDSITRRAQAAFIYIFGLSLVYTALGLLAVQTGQIFGEFTQNAYLHLGFGLLLLYLGGAMMDWYNFPTLQFSFHSSLLIPS